MAWKLDKSNADWSRWTTLNSNCQRKWDEFQNAVNRGSHPQDAARAIGDSDYKCLHGSQYQIRLNQSERATFLVDHTTQTVTVIKVGGHT